MESANDARRGVLHELCGALKDAVWPPACPLCGRGGSAAACGEHRLPSGPEGPRCGRCADRLSDALPAGELCASCRRRPPGYRRAFALGDYSPGSPLRPWILAYKHAGRRDLAPALGAALASWFRAGTSSDTLVVPVPLNPWRRLERGYDQAALLAREFARRVGLDVAALLRRRRWTPPQGAPGASSRAANVAGAFVPRRRARARLRGRAVLLIDDVLTSGATASECARVLRSVGSGRVDVLVLARAVRLRAAGTGPAGAGLE